jgi:hypothetical protein
LIIFLSQAAGPNQAGLAAGVDPEWAQGRSIGDDVDEVFAPEGPIEMREDTGHRGEPDYRLSRGAGLKHRRRREGADVVRHLEPPEGARALRVRLAFGHAFAVELGQLVDEVVVMQQDRPVRADRQRMLIAFTGMPAFVVVVGMGWTSVIVVPFTAG